MKLLERDAQLQALSDMFTSSARGIGGVALGSGAVATGKTAIVRAFTEQAVADDAVLLDSIASRSERTEPLGVVRQLFARTGLSADLLGSAMHILDDAALKMTLYEPD